MSIKNQFKIGTRVKITPGNLLKTPRAVSGAPAGEGNIIWLPNTNGLGHSLYRVQYSAALAFNVYDYELSLALTSKQDLEDEAKRLSEEYTKVTDKINYLKDSGAELFDETEYKIWKVLSTLDNKDYKKSEKAKIIKELIS